MNPYLAALTASLTGCLAFISAFYWGYHEGRKRL